MTTHRPEQPTPDYVAGHDLLVGKVVVVTAAAGAGIGAAVAEVRDHVADGLCGDISKVPRMALTVRT